MAMFDDPKQELKKLEEQLLQDEEWLERELAAARALIGDEPPKKPKNGRKSEASKVRGSDEMQKKAKNVVVPKTNDYALEDKPRKKNRGLVILAILETLGIVGVVVYWLMFLL